MDKRHMFYSVAEDMTHSYGKPYGHIKVVLYTGSVEEDRGGTVSATELVSMTWQRNLGGEPSGWYGFSMDMLGFNSKIARFEDAMSFLRSIENRMKKLNAEELEARRGYAWADYGLDSDTRPEQIGEVMRRLGARQIVKDDRSGEYFLIDKIRPSDQRLYTAVLGQNWLYCLADELKVWTVGEDEAKGEIMKNWSGKLGKCMADRTPCQDCPKVLAAWISEGMPVRTREYDAPAVDMLPDWQLPESEIEQEAEAEEAEATIDFIADEEPAIEAA